MNDLGVLCAFHLALGVLHTIEKLFSFLSFFLSFFLSLPVEMVC